MFHICCSRITIATLHEKLSLDLRRAWINTIVVAVMQAVEKVTEALHMHPGEVDGGGVFDPVD